MKIVNIDEAYKRQANCYRQPKEKNEILFI